MDSGDFSNYARNMKWQEQIYPFPLRLRYQLSPRTSDDLVILLHGYQDNAPSLLKRLGWLGKEDLPFQYLALNAPFPVPIWNADGFKEAYSWYFRDTSRDLILVTPAETAERVAQLIKDLGFAGRPVVFFGFSQGGYLAPYIAKHISNTRGIVGLGCGYTEEGYRDLQPLPVWGIHGSEDERIEIGKARAEHASIAQRGFGGQFTEVPGLRHKVEASVEPLILDFIRRSFEVVDS